MHATELEKLRLQKISNEKFREKEIEAKKLEASAGLAKDALLLCLSEASSCPDLSVSELERIKADAKSCCQKFRMAHLDLATILGDRYENEHRENEKTISESAQIKISELTKLIREKQETRGNSERVLGEQTVKEIKMRCVALNSIVGVTPASMPDSQLLYLNKGLQQFDAEASKILDKVTKYSRYVIELGASEQLSVIKELLADTLHKKEEFILAVHREVEDRDLSEEKIRNALGLKVKIPKFIGCELPMDICTFRTQFEKFVKPYVQKSLLPDTLKNNYLGEPTLTMVKELRDIDEIWE